MQMKQSKAESKRFLNNLEEESVTVLYHQHIN